MITSFLAYVEDIFWSLSENKGSSICIVLIAPYRFLFAFDQL
jgi:hypothetical protein